MTALASAVSLRRSAGSGPYYFRGKSGARPRQISWGRQKPPSRLAGLSLELITDRAGFDLLEDDWNGLHERAAPFFNPFLSFNWCWHWCNHFLGSGSDTELHILTGRRFGRLVMVWPLVRRNVGRMSALTWLGAPVAQYGDVLVDGGDSASALLEQGWCFLRREVAANFIALEKVRADGSIAPLLKQLGFQVIGRERAPYIDLAKADTLNRYAEQFTPEAQEELSDTKHRRRKAGSAGCEFQYEGSEARALAEHLIALKRRWLADEGIVSGALLDPRAHAFFADVAEGLGRPTGCRIVALTCGTDIAAGEVSFAGGGTVSSRIIVLNGDCEEENSLAFLTRDNLRVCKDYGYRRYDFGPSGSLRLDWADGAVEVKDYVAALSFTGRLWVNGYLRWGRPYLKTLANSIPASVRAFIGKLHPALARLR